jgi:hypothetical protein
MTILNAEAMMELHALFFGNSPATSVLSQKFLAKDREEFCSDREAMRERRRNVVTQERR